MADKFNEGLAEGILPQELHPLYHIYVFETPRIMRYGPNVDRFRTLLSNTTDNETRQVCVAKARELTEKTNKVSARIYHYLYPEFTLTDCLGLAGCNCVPTMVSMFRMDKVLGAARPKEGERREEKHLSADRIVCERRHYSQLIGVCRKMQNL
jgi:hypothetical protein